MKQFPMTFRSPSPRRMGAAGIALAALAACQGPLDLDMRGRMGGPLDTSQAAIGATAPRPEADDRGVISYPNYQVAVARRGDTVATLSTRVGLPAQEVAAFNGIQTGDTLRQGEIVALPRRVAEPSAATGAPATTPAPLPGSSQIDVTTLASNALDRAPAASSDTPRTPAPATQPAPGGVEPIRHQVKRGETAFTIARLYNVTPRALADWNALDENFTLREGQYLLIPVTPETGAAPQERADAVTAPGSGSPTPEPPSASKPLPAEQPKPQAEAAAAAAASAPKPDVGQTTSAATSDSAMLMPVSGSIIREYAKGRNDGIDIAAPAGTAVKSAEAGTVAAITRNTDGIPILVIKHDDDLLTVYTHIDGIPVKKGDRVTRGQTIGKVQPGDPPRMHFEVRDGFDSVDPMLYLR
ncbi:peptidoglycan DD-metalloendopeptidase family protein [Roseivivax isoporae]|uniref:Peptidase M23B n=1 Tax=Roseivivax isoporae LMG 25204 TaxID=1449351 RepID=X7F8B4_9RHOB|nr:peptidoglycan DD-metalloendopeptidase family protein [Roseivivax isoporae]ETX28329.1 peptidase M23B [Roseivivax isoporae LMG 25204]